jgi:glycosyltransferase involved in cell wall biosynthesis
MKAGIYDPYLDTLGGGERYTLTFANGLVKLGYEVDVFWNDKSIREKIKERFGFNVDQLNFVDNLFAKDKKTRQGLMKNYDLIFFISDGSIPSLGAKKNILHFQVPFHGVSGKSLLNRLKLRKIDLIVCNSFFTKKVIDKEYGVCSEVLYPPIDVESFKPLKKENLIINVGRFTNLMHSKRQDVLVKSFIKMCDEKKEKIKGWKLVLIGADKEGKEYVSDLKKIAKGYPIEILTNSNFDDLKKFYGQAKIFWTAAGYGFDEEKQPEKMEHFGMTTVEAMACGCVPVVISKGGQKEIVEDGKNGFLWGTEEQLIDKTLGLMENGDKWAKLSKAAQERSLVFSEKKFYERIKKLVG